MKLHKHGSFLFHFVVSTKPYPQIMKNINEKLDKKHIKAEAIPLGFATPRY
jgi:hypothetical protein